jgi:hypothetical protein
MRSLRRLESDGCNVLHPAYGRKGRKKGIIESAIILPGGPVVFLPLRRDGEGAS